jgi:hypothetical protein
MTHRFRSVCLVTALFLASAEGRAEPPSGQGAAATATRAPSATIPNSQAADAAVPSRVGLREQPSFWDDSAKAIKEGGWDIGSWIAYRRQLLVEASLTNRYFWFCITSFLANVVLIYLFYASRVSEDRKLWKATRAMTELWNWALFADWTARTAIDKFNTHIEHCSRAEDVEIVSPDKRKQDLEELARVQNERDSLRQDKVALQEQLADRERAVTNLTSRIDEVATTVSSRDPDSKLSAQLMEKINLLSARNQQLEQQLKSAQTKLEQLAEVTG